MMSNDKSKDITEFSLYLPIGNCVVKAVFFKVKRRIPVWDGTQCTHQLV